MTATIGVVIPHFDDEARLHRTLQALDRQRGIAPTALRVVVADDGSAAEPSVPEGLGYPCTVVTQEDRGFRAAAARNLGAATLLADPAVSLLVFLDGDVVPAPDFVAWMANAAAGEFGREVLLVGARRHADFAGAATDQVLRWVSSGDLPGHRRLTDPAWLADGYRRTDNLRTAGDEDFRLVISAVMAIDRALWRRVGGFDEALVGYGGEDWELAWRCHLAGATLRHVPQAVGWHDGPDIVGRAVDQLSVKNAESAALASRIALPSARGSGVIHEIPHVVIRLRGQHDPARVTVCAQSLLGGNDAAIWLTDAAEVPVALRADPRIHTGEVPRTTLASAPWQLDLTAPVLAGRPLTELIADVTIDGLWTMRHTRSIATGIAPETLAMPTWLELVGSEPNLERRWGGW